ncbi:hypothetical protein [Streptomyces sp. V4I2]|uniref:hypothetical protein n=1 Tax=Streptomyces sp. V4I2 TaxID=3042280 RepID=UPI002785872E|nr:hypothetical protein [Streptomyces sp. V4I2]MDQ1042010.1 hypothetical protein [Streptomyces sp. V4I2]
MRFSIQDGSTFEGVLTYSDSEYGFSFDARCDEALSERLGSEGVTSVVIGTFQLELDIESREVLFAWGYLPNVRREVMSSDAPQFTAGRVAISADSPFEPGVSVAVPGDDWGVSYNPSSGWISIRLRDAAKAEFVEICSGTVLGIDGVDLVSVWLKPVFVE